LFHESHINISEHIVTSTEKKNVPNVFGDSLETLTSQQYLQQKRVTGGTINKSSPPVVYEHENPIVKHDVLEKVSQLKYGHFVCYWLKRHNL